jgi:predicted metal-dependent HD superfamily phosphohydrolase
VNYTYFTASKFSSLCRSAGFSDQSLKADAVFADLARRYSEPQRHYHNARHIEECLEEFSAWRSKAEDPIALEFSIWFHDAIYEPQQSDNEEQSALLAARVLAGNKSLVECVSSLILTTKNHSPGNIPDAALLIDIDLSILGKPTELFWEYEKQIRKEYSWVPLPQYAEKRAAILRAFLSRDFIFRTYEYRERLETQARANLAASIELLEMQQSRSS